jgi:fumarate reductase flavoprotein subunit
LEQPSVFTLHPKKQENQKKEPLMNSNTKTDVKLASTELMDKTTISPKMGFQVIPPLIPAKDIKKTINTDVVVIGAGIAGLTAALSAAEAGAKTVLLEKGATYTFHGLHNAAISSSLQEEAGINVNRNDIISTIMEWGQYRADQKVVTAWADNCNQVMEWLIDKAKKADIDVVLDPATKAWHFPNYPVAHIFWTKEPDRPKAQEALAGMLLSNGQALGVDYCFQTPARQLLREGTGPVTGVIAQNPDGSYVQFNASRAIVLCTGDYGGNNEMVETYCDRGKEISNLRCLYGFDGQNSGDGHKMGMWIGGAIDDFPHCPMLFDFASFKREGLFNLGRQPWLYVNLNGERFMNEDLPWSYECNQMLRQPDGLAWSLWDAKYNEEWPKMRSQCCKNMGPPLFRFGPELLGPAVEKGHVLTADSIEGLAQKMGVPIETCKATVARYNQMAKNADDTDFGKHPDRLTTLVKPPYYACRFEVRRLVMLSGLKIDEKLRVLDKEGNAIPRLYAAGNVSGSFFGAPVYPTTIPGLTHSRAWTFGRLAGLSASAESVQGHI